MEGRVTSVELRPINLLTAAQIAAALAGEDETLDGGPDTVVGLDAPNQYKPVIDGYFYAKDLTGSGSRVDLYFTTDTGLSKGDTIQISGIHDLVHPNNSTTGTRELEISSDNYKTISVDTPPWDNRSSYNGTRNVPDSTITHSVLFNPSSGSDYSSAKKLIVKRKIASVSATTTTATVTFASTNYFKVGDAVYVDMPSDTPFYGIDGLYRVKTVGSNFITFDFSSALDEPINSSTVTEDRYVHAVARSYTRDGATYIDTSSDPDVVYIWKDIRWVTYSTGDVTKDSLAPSPIENLEATDEDETPAGAAVPQRRVTLSWSAPTTNVDGTPLDDLIGYTIWSKKFASQPWAKRDMTGNDTNWSDDGYLQGKPAYFRVFARDSGGNLSTGVDITHTTGISTPTVETPKAPTVTTYLGTIKIAYDDLTASGLVQAATAKEIEVFFSDVTGFTPDETNYYGKFPANAGSYIIIPGTEIVDNTDYYIKIRVRDIYGNITEPSTQVAIRAKIKNIVTFDMIDVGTLTGQVIIGLDMRTSAKPFDTGGIIMNQQGITAYDAAGGQTFRIDATNGAVSIGDYLGREEAAGLYIGSNVADGKYQTKPSQGTFITDITAGQIFLSQESASSNYVTKLSAGTLYLAKGGAAGDINANSTTIDGGKITTKTIAANRIGSGTLPVDVIYAGDISATNITSGTLTGRLVRSSASGTRIELDAANDRIAIYNGTNLRGRIFGDTAGLRLMGTGLSGIRVSSTDTTIFGEDNANFLQLGDAGGVASFVVSSNSVRFSILGNGVTTKRYVFANERGGLFASTSTASVSDERLKSDINPSNLGLKVVNDLNPVKFNWKYPANDAPHEQTAQYGLIAQELRTTLDRHGIQNNSLVVEEVSKGYESKISDLADNPVLAIDYTQLVPVLIKSIQELSAKIDTLNDEIDKMKDSK
jgi:hypothetical protein